MIELVLLFALVLLLVLVLGKMPEAYGLKSDENILRQRAGKVSKKSIVKTQQVKEGIDEAEKEIREHERDISRILREADHLKKDGKFKSAENKLVRLISKYPNDAGIYNKLGLIYLEQKNYKDAAKTLEYALSLEPENDSIHNNLGLVYYAREDYGKAAISYEKAIDLNDQVASRFANLGLAHYMVRKYGKASDAFEKALILEPQNEEYQKLLRETEEKSK